MDIKNKRILITAGPTWVPIDKVRVISNIASGKTGILLAEGFLRKGWEVTLVLGPLGHKAISKQIRLIHFDFFNDLRKKLIKELKSRQYDVIIHSAAVSDFRPKAVYKGKLISNKKYRLELVPLPKLIGDIKLFAAKARLVTFKLEFGASKNSLLKSAKEALSCVGADMVVANSFEPYRCFIIGKEGIITSLKSKEELARKLVTII